ncbi:H-2 class II histocompatibility antigen, A beta chain-like [Xenopus laevis]|uniref:H-2 class II histocompatibility antigen, A beta chain-like n=1 Tax=Xenopus laevis TaxID=8355 RepID=A0A8J1LM91_XENLA|nr:H-2 class II histocompatibility antigen, A beta chain-like [Xenopus laevis]
MCEHNGFRSAHVRVSDRRGEHGGNCGGERVGERGGHLGRLGHPVGLARHWYQQPVSYSFQPNVKISSSESDSSTTIHCHVHGFYPREVDVKWIKNGRDEIDSEEAPEILPNPDGTYQIRVSVEVTPEEGATYSCHVDHSSLNNEIVVDFKSKHRSAFYILISVTVLGLFLAGLGIFIHKRVKGRKGSRQTVSTVEEDFTS